MQWTGTGSFDRIRPIMETSLAWNDTKKAMVLVKWSQDKNSVLMFGLKKKLSKLNLPHPYKQNARSSYRTRDATRES